MENEPQLDEWSGALRSITSLLIMHVTSTNNNHEEFCCRERFVDTWKTTARWLAASRSVNRHGGEFSRGSDHGKTSRLKVAGL